MTEIFIKQNPFSGEMILKRDGENIPKMAKLSSFHNRFIKQAFSLLDDVRDEYNDDEMTLALSTAPFEVFLFDAISGGGKSFQVVRRDFLISLPLQERLAKLVALLKKYAQGQTSIAPVSLRIFCPDDALYGEVTKKFECDYPELGQIGITLERSKNRASINLVRSEADIASAPGQFSAPAGAGFKTVFIIGDEAAIRLDGDTVFWRIPTEKAFEILKSYLERFFVIDYFNRLLKVFPTGECSEDDSFILQTLDKVDETILVALPRELEVGTSTVVVGKTFSGDPCPEFQVESTYPEIIDAVCSDGGKITLQAMSPGTSEIKVFRAGTFSPIFQEKINAVDYGYATSVEILVEGEKVRNHVFTPGDSARISLRYSPADSPKTKEDVRRGKWAVSSPERLAFDAEKMTVTALQPGIGRLSVKLSRVGDEIPFVVKPKVTDFAVQLLNVPTGSDQVIRYSDGRPQEPEYIKMFIGKELNFKISLLPEDGFPVIPQVVGSSGLTIKTTDDHLHFTVAAARIGQSETLQIKVPGCERVVSVALEIIPHPGTADTSSKLPTFIGIAAGGAALLWLLVLLGVKTGVFLIIVGVVAIALDLVVRKKISGENKASETDKKSAFRIVDVMLALSVLALLAGMIPSRKGKPDLDRQPAFSNVGTSAKVRITTPKKELLPTDTSEADRVNGVILKLWSGWPDYDKWTYKFFTSAENMGATIDTGKGRLGSRVLAVFSPELILLSDSLRRYAKDESLISCHASLKIDEADEYMFFISHYDIPAKWSSGAYAVFIDGQEIIRLQNQGYNPDNNRTYSAKAKLAAGYHDFLFVYEVNWKCPQASNSAISIKGTRNAAPKQLTVNELFIPKDRFSQIQSQARSATPASTSLTDVPAYIKEQIEKNQAEIAKLTKKIDTARRNLKTVTDRAARNKRPENFRSRIEALQESIESLESQRQKKQQELNALTSQLGVK